MKYQKPFLAGACVAVLLAVLLGASVPIQNMLLQGNMNAGNNSITNVASLNATSVNTTNLRVGGTNMYQLLITFMESALTSGGSLVLSNGTFAGGVTLTNVAGDSNNITANSIDIKGGAGGELSFTTNFLNFGSGFGFASTGVFVGSEYKVYSGGTSGTLVTDIKSDGSMSSAGGALTWDASGHLVAAGYAGPGSGLTALNGANITSGTIPDSSLFSTFLKANQTITVTGDATGSGTTAITLTLKSTGTAGTYRSATFDAQGRETGGSNPTTISGYGLSDTWAALEGALSGIISLDAADAHTNTYGGLLSILGTRVIEGEANTAPGLDSHAEGNGNTAGGNQAHAEGAGTFATGAKAHAEGSGTTASAANTHAEGFGSQASAAQAHAEGNNTVASGVDSWAGGDNASAIHNNAYVWSDGTVATSPSANTYSVFAGSGIFLNGLEVDSTGDLLTTFWFVTPHAAPSTPPGSLSVIYVDSTSQNIAVKNAGGVVNHGVQTKTSTSHQFLTAIADNGSVTAAQPAFSDLSSTPTTAAGYGFTLVLADLPAHYNEETNVVNSGIFLTNADPGVVINVNRAVQMFRTNASYTLTGFSGNLPGATGTMAAGHQTIVNTSGSAITVTMPVTFYPIGPATTNSLVIPAGKRTVVAWEIWSDQTNIANCQPQ